MIVFCKGSCSFSQDADKVIAELDTRLNKGQISISSILSDPKYMYLHSQKEFRQVIRKNAKAGKIKIITDGEPGKKITVKGKIETADNKPLVNALLYFYHTSDKGWYSDTAAHIQLREGDMGHARLFGYLKTDSKGQFEFETIQPQGYPRSDFPGHIHIMAWRDDKIITGLPNELQFEDDPRMTAERKTRSLQEGNRIEKNSGTATSPVYYFDIKARNY